MVGYLCMGMAMEIAHFDGLMEKAVELLLGEEKRPQCAEWLRKLSVDIFIRADPIRRLKSVSLSCTLWQELDDPAKEAENWPFSLISRKGGRPLALLRIKRRRSPPYGKRTDYRSGIIRRDIPVHPCVDQRIRDDRRHLER